VDSEGGEVEERDDGRVEEWNSGGIITPN